MEKLENKGHNEVDGNDDDEYEVESDYCDDLMEIYQMNGT